MKAYPIYSSLMSLENFDALDFNSDETPRCTTVFGDFLFENRIIPDADSGVQRSRHNIVLLWMELGTHYKVRVPSYDVYAVPTLIVPNSHCLVIGC